VVPAWPLRGRGVCCPDVFSLMSLILSAFLGEGRPAEELGKNSRAKIVSIQQRKQENGPDFTELTG